MPDLHSTKVRICEIKRHWGETLVAPLQQDPKHRCKNCGEKAKEEGNLCNPEELTVTPRDE
jgi:hypothetical protein